MSHFDTVLLAAKELPDQERMRLIDELFETLTLVQTGKAKPVPIVLFGADFWNSLLNFQVMVDAGTIAEEDLALFHITDDPQDAWNKIKAFYQL